MSMTARDYFFTIFAPEHAGRSYQAAYHYDALDLEKRPHLDVPVEEYQEAVAKAVSHVPRRSNDIVIEEAMEDLICRVPVDLRARLERMFVAKIRDFEPNAAALCNAGSYEGDLLFFNVGLSDVRYQYAIVYYECVSLIGNHMRPSLLDNGAGLDELVEHMWKLMRTQHTWDRLGYDRPLSPDDVIDSNDKINTTAARLSHYADVFILRHEISHHILGHTERGAKLLSYVEDLPEHCKYWTRVDWESHQMEYEADASALSMTLQHQYLDVETARRREFEVVIEELLTFTVLGQLVQDVEDVTASHPSVSSRFDQCVDILRSTCKYSVREYILLIKKFQKLLWHAQSKGLGRRWGDVIQLE